MNKIWITIISGLLILIGSVVNVIIANALVSSGSPFIGGVVWLLLVVSLGVCVGSLHSAMVSSIKDKGGK